MSNLVTACLPMWTQFHLQYFGSKVVHHDILINNKMDFFEFIHRCVQWRLMLRLEPLLPLQLVEVAAGPPAEPPPSSWSPLWTHRFEWEKTCVLFFIPADFIERIQSCLIYDSGLPGEEVKRLKKRVEAVEAITGAASSRTSRLSGINIADPLDSKYTDMSYSGSTLTHSDNGIGVGTARGSGGDFQRTVQQLVRSELRSDAFRGQKIIQ